MEERLLPAGLRIVFTGPESSGKSTLAQRAAEHFQGKYVPEYGRTWMEEHGLDYTMEDVLHMARIQAEENTRPSAVPVFCDTEMVNFRLWSQEELGEVHPVIEELWKQQSFDQVIICAPDIPWVDDGIRTLPHRREELFLRFQEEFDRAGIDYEILCGEGEARWRSLLKIVKSIPSSDEDAANSLS